MTTRTQTEFMEAYANSDMTLATEKKQRKRPAALVKAIHSPLVIVDYQCQSTTTQAFADAVEQACKVRRERFGNAGYFNTIGDMILTAFQLGMGFEQRRRGPQ